MSEFDPVPAVRGPQNLIIGLTGASSSGKTWTALELAMGIQSVVGGEIGMIDTENKRGLAYADNFRKKDGSPGYQHTNFAPPWSSDRYVAAIEHVAKTCKTIIVDSMSHEHDGEGGMLDFQEHEVERMSQGDWKKAERVKMLAWAKPKAARRRLIRTIARIDANLILCFRAKNSSKPGKDADQKSIVIPMGFVPIAGDEFVFEAALSALFLPGARGVPTWHSEFPGESMAIKVPKQFEWLRERRGPLNAETGRMLAEWARGGAAKTSAAQRQPERQNAPTDRPAQEERPSEPQSEPNNETQKEMYVLLTANETGRFDSEMEYLEAYENAVKTLVEHGKPSDLLLFDKHNGPMIAKHPTLDPILKRINATIRKPAGGLV